LTFLGFDFLAKGSGSTTIGALEWAVISRDMHSIICFA